MTTADYGVHLNARDGVGHDPVADPHDDSLARRFSGNWVVPLRDLRIRFPIVLPSCDASVADR